MSRYRPGVGTIVILTTVIVAFCAVMVYPFVRHPPSKVDACHVLMEVRYNILPKFLLHDKVTSAETLAGVEGLVMIGDTPVLCPHCKHPFQWMVNPPSGDRIVMSGPGVARRFYICCSRPDSRARRIFLFSGSVSPVISDSCELLGDREVSWYFQKKRSDLSERERGIDSQWTREQSGE